MRTLCFAANVVAAAALANNKPVHGARHKALLMESPVESGSPLLLRAVDGTPIWGRCAEDQLALPFKPLKADHCLQANLVYVRIPKSGSTSFTSVLKRIGSRAGVNGVESPPDFHAKLPEPFVSAVHIERFKMQDFIQSKVKPIVKVTMVREPVARYLSSYYYMSTKFSFMKNVTVMDFFQTRRKNFEYDYLRRDKAQEEDVESVLDEYALVGVTERFEESVVLLTEMLGLSYCDVMYSDGKVGGEERGVEFTNGKPLRASTPLSEQPQEVRDYVASAEYQGFIANDLKLYAAANTRLDELIDRVGRNKFDAKVEDFKRWRNRVLESRCKSELTLQGDAAEWFKQNCYKNDVGCGYKCFDNLCKAQGDVVDDSARAKSRGRNQVTGERSAAQANLVDDDSDNLDEVQILPGEEVPIAAQANLDEVPILPSEEVPIAAAGQS